MYGHDRPPQRLVEKIVLPENRPGVQNRLDELLDELSNIFKGVYLIRDLSPKTTDMILSYGERLSSEIVCGAVAGSVRYDAREFIKTKPLFNRHVVDFASTEKLIERRFEKMPHVAIVPGFIATDLANGDATNLGRGGSDYTAAILASTLKASALEIWTDVDGFMTADPKVINDAYVIEHLSYVEAMELCNFGAKVIYPPTIFPAYHKNIPIVIRNTFNLDSKGTAISRESSGDASRAIKGISSINDTCLITIQGLGMVGVIGVNYRIFKTLAKSGISVFLVSQAASENTTSIGVRNDDADLAMEVLTEEFAQEIALGEINKIKKEPNLATIAIVGENMKHTPGIAGKLFGTLGRSGINVIACAQGASETNISFVVSLDSLAQDVERASRFVLPVRLPGVEYLYRRSGADRKQLAGTDPPAAGQADEGKFLADPGGRRDQLQTVYRRPRRSRPEDLSRRTPAFGKRLDAGGIPGCDPVDEYFQLRFRGLHGQRRGCGYLQGSAGAQRFGRGRQQDRGVVRIRPLSRTQIDCP